MSPLISGKIPPDPEKKGLSGGRQHLLSVLVALTPFIPSLPVFAVHRGSDSSLIVAEQLCGLQIAHVMS